MLHVGGKRSKQNSPQASEVEEKNGDGDRLFNGGGRGGGAAGVFGAYM